MLQGCDETTTDDYGDDDDDYGDDGDDDEDDDDDDWSGGSLPSFNIFICVSTWFPCREKNLEQLIFSIFTEWKLKIENIN